MLMKSQRIIMAPGWFAKVGEVLKNIGTGIKNVVGKVVAPIASIAGPLISAIPHPAAQAIGRGMSVAAPVVSRLFNE